MKKEIDMTTITDYAHDYLSGYNNVPIGVLDSAEFKAEVARLSGYTPPTPAQVAARQAQIDKAIGRVVKMMAALSGPMGGRPKKGQALKDYKNLEYNLAMLKSQSVA